MMMSREKEAISSIRFLFVILLVLIFKMHGAIEKLCAEDIHLMRTENTTRIIECPEKPAHGILRLELDSPLSIGSESDERYFFSSLRDIKIDSEYRIYALDNLEARIKIYDKDGTFLGTIGRKGQGPGEFAIPYYLSLDQKRKIYVYDSMMRKITIFSSDWNYRDSISLNEILHGSFCVDEEENLYFNKVDFESDGSMYISLNKWSPEKNVRRLIAKGLFLVPIVDGNSRMIYEHPYQRNLYFSLLNDGKLVFVMSAEPTIHIVSSEGNLLTKVLIKKKLEKITKEEKELIFKIFFQKINKALHDKVYFPEYRPLYSNLVVDDKNRVYLEKLNPIGGKSFNYSYSVFNEVGKYLYDLVVNFRISYIGRGHIYSIKTDEESGKTSILRYKIKNWEQIEE